MSSCAPWPPLAPAASCHPGSKAIRGHSGSPAALQLGVKGPTVHPCCLWNRGSRCASARRQSCRAPSQRSCKTAFQTNGLLFPSSTSVLRTSEQLLPRLPKANIHTHIYCILLHDLFCSFNDDFPYIITLSPISKSTLSVEAYRVLIFTSMGRRSYRYIVFIIPNKFICFKFETL